MARPRGDAARDGRNLAQGQGAAAMTALDEEIGYLSAGDGVVQIVGVSPSGKADRLVLRIRRHHEIEAVPLAFTEEHGG